MNIEKLYCFVDETGQDTKGRIFFVVVIIEKIEKLNELQNQLENTEKNTNKKTSKWKKTSNNIKVTYLKELLKIKDLKNSVYYAQYKASTKYSNLTALTIASAIKISKRSKYTANIIIDGLNNKEREIIKKALKELKIKYTKIRGIKDEQNVFIRLADAMAGFIRDSTEKDDYTKNLFEQFENKNILKKI